MLGFRWQRAVIKVGSSLVSPSGDGCSAQFLLPIAQFISAARAQGKEVVLVSSGSVAAGRSSMEVKHAPTIAEKQAMAAIGQTKMMANWQRFFDSPCAQVLLTYSDLKSRTRYVNIKNTLTELLSHHAIPIVNENDTVAVNELKVGDNDNLAAYTALVAQADTLIICSDIDGLYTSDPRYDSAAQLIPEVEQIDDALFAVAGGAGSSVGTGGMKTKLQAAQKCMQSGIQTLIVNGRKPHVFDTLRDNLCPGTLFQPQLSPQRARQLWLSHTLESKGRLHIDKGAQHALLQNGASLLPSGIVRIEGVFSAGEAIDIVFDGQLIAKGLTQFNHNELIKVLGLQSEQMKETLGYPCNNEIVHRNDLVLSSFNI
jgi:glutamate 5-kinase